jgi:superfamily II DNA or RNA helicase
MFNTKEEFQKEGLRLLQENNYTGTIVADTGASKSKIAIDAIKEGKFKSILITSPRTNLKQSWKDELEKWNITETPLGWWYNKIFKLGITLENIQTCYKWTKEYLQQFDLIIVDEVHTVGPEYSAFITIARKLEIPCIGLTATPDKSNEFKRDVLYKMLPILIEYHSAEKDGLINKVNYIIYEHELSNDYKVLTGNKTNKWYIGEKAQYEYLTEKYNYAKKLMFEQGASDYWNNALVWMKTGNPFQKKAGTEFFRAVNNRKNFLWNLTSTAEIAIRVKHKLLSPFNTVKEGDLSLSWIPNPAWGESIKNNKVLLFSELTPQASKLSNNVIHSNVGKTAKITQQLNEETLRKFNTGEIRDLASVKSLTLGLNMIGVNWAIFESYSGSDVQGSQKKGRLHRLSVDEVANVIIIVVKGTQYESWFNNAFPFVKNPRIIRSVDEL